MKVYVSVDMEGVAGIVTSQQCRAGSDGYPAAQRLMTQEANAAVEGAFDGGADEVVVSDCHARMINLLQEELDERALLVSGRPKPHGVMEGIDREFEAVFFVGYHAEAGAAHAVRAHTYSGLTFTDVRLDGSSISEAELNAMVAAEHGVPVGLVSGDDAVCALAEKRFRGVRTVPVKQAAGVSSASSLHPKRARAAIRDAAARVVADGTPPAPEERSGPLVLEVDLHYLEMAELCAFVPGATRSSRTVSISVADALELARCIEVFAYLAQAAPAPGR